MGLDSSRTAEESWGHIFPFRGAWLKHVFRVIIVAALAACVFVPLAAQDYDLVIANGRVMDPESGLDGPRHIGVRAGKVVAISETPLAGGQQIDARGLVVAPGFIDLHSHGQ